MRKKDMPRSSFSLNLIRIRKERGLSQRELAKISGVSYRSIAFYETKAINPPMRNLDKLADALRVSVNDLLSISNERKSKLPKELEDLITEIDTKTLKKLVQIKKLPPNDRAIIYRMLSKMTKPKKSESN